MSGVPRKIAELILFSVISIFPIKLFAQETSPLYFLSGVPQASIENPAIQNKTGKLAIGLPVLSGIHLNLNSNMAFNYLFTDGFNYSFHRFYDTLDEQGKTQAGISVSVFFASLKHNNFTYSLSVSERGIANGNFDRNIVKLIRDGTINYYGTNQSLGSGFLQFRHYKEFGIGIAYNVWEGFDVGIRPKLLFGKYILDTDEFNVSTQTNTMYNELRIGIDGTYIMSGPLSYDDSFKAKIFPGDYFFQLKNLGAGLDAGFVLKTENSVELSLSLLDIGAISFGHNVFDMKMARPFRYAESELYQSHTHGNNHYLEPREALKQLTDSISYFLDVEDSNIRKVSLLPMKLNAAAKYYLSETTAFGISNQFTWYKKQPLNLLSAFTNIKIGTRFEMAGSLSLYNLTEIAPGFGASYSSRWMQIFMASNNILEFIYPTSVKHVNLSFGMNFLFDTQ
jgi:hypothetical protein